MKVAVDWSHKEDKLAVHTGLKARKTFPKMGKGDVVFAENIPMKKAKTLLANGVKIMRCNTKIVSQMRKSMGLEKTDELDAKLIWQLSEEQPEAFREWQGDPVLTTLYRSFKEIQQARVRQDNRVWAKEEGVSAAILKDLEGVEKRILKQIETEIAKYPIWEWLKQIKGVGPSIGGGIIGIIAKYGIKNINQVSSLWHLFGLHVVNGKAPRLAKGSTISYIPEAKTLVLGVLSSSFIKQRSPVYSDVYYQEKERQLARVYPAGELAERFNGYKKEDIHVLKDHAHRRAIRKMAKVFMQHLWVAWRMVEGCETRPLYAHEYLGHEHYIEPPIEFPNPPIH